MTACNKDILNRLKRTEGQLRGIQKMIEDEKECVDVITQLSAVSSSINRIMGIIVAENLKNCLENPDSDTETQKQKIDQAVQLIVKK
ncbi:metal-sensitive transcriptional regulator [Enterococcus casseliflavus]|uniref:metal-sensitive transcriptional regulator n=1 Tax=Enterococcus casseliflavus TaxID=37734 RepID=UPI0012E231AA|nr:metal-sensitive transcriptional regulator [Enterococcus casseliflavus]MUN74787.1 metal-sensing transcriptional repressor [Enterococcus casseliflavus]MUN97604.1 metal-sensing transcriptional repressor [Enterococcus casseliflavus]